MKGFKAKAGPPTRPGLQRDGGDLGVYVQFPRLTSMQQIRTRETGNATKFGTLVGSPKGPELGAPGC